jgi:hypothetical protein
MPLDDPDNPLAVEIRQETAAAYFAVCKKMVASLEALTGFDREVASRSTDEKQLRRRSELFEDAVERVYSVVIQREAMKLSGYEEFFDNYGVPPEVRARLGVPRRR